MAGNDKKTGSNPVDIIVYGMMIAAVVYVIVQCILGNNDALHFKIVLGMDSGCGGCCGLHRTGVEWKNIGSIG